MELDNLNRFILPSLFAEFSVNDSLKEKATDLINAFFTREPVEEFSEMLRKSLAKFSIFCVQTEQQSKKLEFSKVFESEFSNWSMYVGSFSKFLALSSLPSRIIEQVSGLLQDVQVSRTLFYRLSNIWKSLNVQGNTKLLEQVMQSSWILFISSRSELLNRTNSIGDCMFLMIGVVTFTLNRLPIYLSLPDVQENSLHSLLKITPADEFFWTTKVMDFCNNYLQPFGLNSKKPDFKGIFSRKNISASIKVFEVFYTQHTQENAFDERYFSFYKKECVNGGHTVPVRNINGKVLNYEPEYSDYNDVVVTLEPPTTPLTMSMEMLNWMSFITCQMYFDKESVESCDGVEGSLRFQEQLEKIVADHGIRSETLQFLIKIPKEHIEVKVSHLFNAIFRVFTRERSNELNFHYEESVLAKCLFVYCVEIVFYTKSIIFITFSEILSTYGCSGFEFWRFLPFFSSIPQIPQHFQLHLNKISSKILMQIGWKENETIHLTITEYINNSNTEPLQDNFNKYKGIFPEEYENFFEKAITEAGCRIDTLCKALKIEGSIKEKIWLTLKYVLSEKTEMVFGRHIAVIILCCIFAVSKLTAPIKFKGLIKEYWDIFQEDEGIFSCLKLKDGREVEIIEYYNTEFVKNIRMFIDNRIEPIKPRVAILSPGNSLAEQINGAAKEKKSPFTTPRTKFLLASPITSGKTSLFKPVALNFDSSEAPKIPRLIEMMLQQNNESLLPVPIIKKSK